MQQLLRPTIVAMGRLKCSLEPIAKAMAVAEAVGSAGPPSIKLYTTELVIRRYLQVQLYL